MYQRIRLAPAGAKPVADALAVMMLARTKTLPEGCRKLDQQWGGALSAAMARPEFAAGRGDVTCVYPPVKGAPRLYVLGLGDRGKFTAEAVRIAAAKFLPAAHAAKVRAVEFHVMPVLDGLLDASAVGRALGDGLSLGSFRFDQYKGRTANNGNGQAKDGVRDLTVQAEPALRAALDRALTVGRSVTLARRLAATPPNVANTTYVANYCRRLARQVGLRCTVIDARQARQLGMGGLLAVGGAGSQPPLMVCLEWNGTHGRKTPRSQHQPGPRGPIVLVGKTITFDTGGYSLKPNDSMVRMKYDKSGGAAVIGALHATAVLRLPVHVVGLIPAAENMISPRAYRPDDILTFCNGVTAEVTNTDAEGRLILADALAHASKAYRPAALIDLATLTGGVVVALGSFCAGVFCDDDKLRERLFAAADDTGERLWRLPLWDEHKQMMKGAHSDIVNAAGREASPIQGAAFLSYFVGAPQGRGPARGAGPRKSKPIPWAHVDIAGMSDVKSDTPLYAKGPTGFGVRLLVRLLETWR